MAISVIICSRDSSNLNSLLDNLKKTIGCDFEIITIDNSMNDFSIFQAYNIGIKRAKFHYLVFIHEDVIVHTENWGRSLIELFEKHPEFGLLGIAGSRLKTRMPSAWWETNSNVWRLIQHFKYKPKENWDDGFNGRDLEEVSVIDGVFMAMRRDSRIKFDERLKGFHNYDMSISLLHKSLNKRVGVTRKILIEHFSEGNLDISWLKSTSEFHRLYKGLLPSFIRHNSNSLAEIRKKEIMLGYDFVNKLIKQNSRKEALYWWWQLFRLKPISKYHIRIFNKLISGR